jgi:hypothetical protein
MIMEPTEKGGRKELLCDTLEKKAEGGTNKGQIPRNRPLIYNHQVDHKNS